MPMHQLFRGACDRPMTVNYGGRSANGKAQKHNFAEKRDVRWEKPPRTRVRPSGKEEPRTPPQMPEKEKQIARNIFSEGNQIPRN